MENNIPKAQKVGPQDGEEPVERERESFDWSSNSELKVAEANKGRRKQRGPLFVCEMRSETCGFSRQNNVPSFHNRWIEWNKKQGLR